jgi:iron complex transport system substrate-binding protein
MILRAGGVNAAAEAGLVDWNQISEEAVISMNPDAVILSPYVTDEEFKTNPVYATLNAVVNDRVVSISDAYMSATSQYIVLGVESVAHLLHPEMVPAP